MGESNGSGKWKLWALGASFTFLSVLATTWSGCIWSLTQETKRDVLNISQRTSALEANYTHIRASLERIELKLDRKTSSR